jgi:hypothetical protein
VLVGCDSPPQIVEISPQRGAVDVRSSDPVLVRFDRAMDRSSVESRFHVQPETQGSLRWLSDGELAFEHASFNTSTRYQVVLDGGYRDAQGGVNSLRHSWAFHTEAAPTMSGSSPGGGEQGADPASYISLAFSRQMDLGSLAGAVSISPGLPFSMRQDPSDPRHVVLVPQTLLDPHTNYTVAVTDDARDVDGNRLMAGRVDTFSTGDLGPLKHWVGFIADGPAGPDGVWIVNESRLPRRLVSSDASAFSWSADSSRLLIRSQAGSWTDVALDGTSTSLPFQADWAGYLAPGRGYAVLDRGTLRIEAPGADAVTVATGVTAAAVAPGGSQLAYVTGDAGPGQSSVIWGYQVELRSRFRIQAAGEPVDGLSWSPDGQSLAFRLGSDPSRRRIQVRSVRDGSLATVASGEVSTPTWQADRQHLFVMAVVATPHGSRSKAFRVAIAGGGDRTLTAGEGMPAGADAQVASLSPSADGHQLAVISDSSGRPGVWLMNADGTGLAPLTDLDPQLFPYTCRAVAWTPS